MGRYDRQKDNFAVAGPTHLTQTEVDWKNEEHRRCITACLVKATYILESEHQIRRTEGNLASAWWEKFHFRLHHVLHYACNCVGCKNHRRIIGGQSTRSFVYGAVFEYVPPDDAKSRQPSSAPQYVVAFRGTMPKNATVFDDMGLNLSVLFNTQRFCRRFEYARDYVTSLLGSSTPPAAGGGRVVWLAGHSLGASIALDVGRYMVTTGGYNLPTFLFNPPHVSAAPLIDVVLPEKAKRNLYILSYVFKCALAKTIIPKSHAKRMEKLFEQLSPWVPNLYVHQRDLICNGFIDYFQKRAQVKDWSTRVGNSAATLSYRDMVDSVFHKQSERPHLLPCAVMWMSSHDDDDPHGLRHWWRPTGQELALRRDEYSWPLI